MWVNLLLSVLLGALCLNVEAFQKYRQEIPNGNQVPNPCNQSTIWAGVGHQAKEGAGPRNPFGLDWAANDHVWNETICKKDSDGDGKTNGQELGDPNCIWKKGSNATFITGLSHPGICEPIDSPGCAVKNSWMTNCMPKKLDCPAIEASGVRNYTLRLPVTPIPTKETTYICHQFKLPNDSVSDIIAIEPVLDNARILHHMLLFAFNDEPKDHQTGDTFECSMEQTAACNALIGTWGVGIAGQCINSQMGFRTGKGGFQYALLQLHWNNPENTANLTDSSGMRIYHTTQLRPNKGQVAITGQASLLIPPRQPAVTFQGTCTSVCTLQMKHSIFLTSASLHMHSLGKSGEIRLIRRGLLTSTVQILDNVTQYDYNTPTLLEFQNPIEVKPGDEIQVKCVFDSSKKNTTTVYGESTSDEMCFAFLAYYPLIEYFGFCGQWKILPLCPKTFEYGIGSCELAPFIPLLNAILP